MAIFLGCFFYYTALKFEHGLKGTINSMIFEFWMTFMDVIGRVKIEAWGPGNNTENCLRPGYQSIDVLM